MSVCHIVFLLPHRCKKFFSFITGFFPSVFAPSPALPQAIASSRSKLLSFYGHFINKSSVSVTQAFTHLAISMQFSFQALILLYEVMELMRFYPVPHTHTNSACISPHFPRQTSTPPSVANLSVFSLASPALLTRGNLFKD